MPMKRLCRFSIGPIQISAQCPAAKYLVFLLVLCLPVFFLLLRNEKRDCATLT